MRYKNKVKIKLSGLFLGFTLFLPVGVRFSESNLPIDQYWRYQNFMWAKYIENTGHFKPSPFPNHSLLVGWLNEFSDNVASPVVVTITSEITGLPIIEVVNLPLFSLSLIFSTALVANFLFNHTSVFICSTTLGVSFNYYFPHMMNSAHRGALGWAIVFTFLALMLVNNSKLVRIAALLVLIPTLAMSVHTLPLSSFIFFTTLVIGGKITGDTVISHREYLLMISIVTLYYGIIWDWVGEVLIRLGLAISGLLSINSIQFHTIYSSASLHPTIVSYLLQWENQLPIYDISFTIASIIAVILVSVAVLHRIYHIYYSYFGYNKMDIIMLGFIAQGIIDIILITIFAGSGGINPLTLGLIITPLFGPYAVFILSGYISSVKIVPKNMVLVLLIIIVVTPAFTAYISVPLTDGNQLSSAKKTDISQMEWTNEFIAQNERIISDFNTLSMYYATGGDGKTYLPPPGSPAYSSKIKANRLINLYYKAPAVTGRRYGSVFLVSSHMTNFGMVHIGSIGTKANPKLDNMLERNNNWNKVYVSGRDKIFTYDK